MTEHRGRLWPIEGSARVGRQPEGLRAEVTGTVVPTVTMNLVLWLVGGCAHERARCAALAASASPGHVLGTETNRVLSATHAS